jgi:hypothetical protein
METLHSDTVTSLANPATTKCILKSHTVGNQWSGFGLTLPWPHPHRAADHSHRAAAYQMPISRGGCKLESVASELLTL